MKVRDDDFKPLFGYAVELQRSAEYPGVPSDHCDGHEERIREHRRRVVEDGHAPAGPGALKVCCQCDKETVYDSDELRRQGWRQLNIGFGDDSWWCGNCTGLAKRKYPKQGVRR